MSDSIMTDFVDSLLHGEAMQYILHEMNIEELQHRVASPITQTFNRTVEDIRDNGNSLESMSRAANYIWYDSERIKDEEERKRREATPMTKMFNRMAEDIRDIEMGRIEGQPVINALNYNVQIAAGIAQLDINTPSQKASGKADKLGEGISQSGVVTEQPSHEQDETKVQQNDEDQSVQHKLNQADCLAFWDQTKVFVGDVLQKLGKCLSIGQEPDIELGQRPIQLVGYFDEQNVAGTSDGTTRVLVSSLSITSKQDWP